MTNPQPSHRGLHMIGHMDCAIRRGIAVAALACVALAANTANAEVKRFTFGLWGDMPYAKANDQPKIPALIKDINASDIDFSMYDGDIKDGSSKCTDDAYADAI